MNIDFKELQQQLSQTEEFIFNNEESFKKLLSSNYIFTVTEVSLSSHDVKVVYISDCGRHICDHIDIEVFKEWISETLRLQNKT